MHPGSRNPSKHVLHTTVHFKRVKMVTSVTSVFYHNLKKTRKQKQGNRARVLKSPEPQNSE